MRIVTERGTLLRTADGRTIIRWNNGENPIQQNVDRLQLFVDNTVARHMDAYVPMRTGILKKSVILGSRMGSGELVYVAPYAKKRYYTPSRKELTGSSGIRGSKWFQRMWAARQETIVREVRNYTRRIMP